MANPYGLSALWGQGDCIACGMVWGIYHALIAIGIAEQASIDKVAGPVGKALIMTALGLTTTVLSYDWPVPSQAHG